MAFAAAGEQRAELPRRGGAIIAGYGFTNERRFLYVLDKTDGRVAKQIPLRGDPEWLVEKEGRLFVRTYDADLVFAFTGQ